MLVENGNDGANSLITCSAICGSGFMKFICAMQARFHFGRRFE